MAHPGIRQTRPGYVGFTSANDSTSAFDLFTNDDGENGCYVRISGNGDYASIWLDLDQVRALAGVLMDYIADFEG
jgi:hypothetical protein